MRSDYSKTNLTTLHISNIYDSVLSILQNMENVNVNEAAVRVQQMYAINAISTCYMLVNEMIKSPPALKPLTESICDWLTQFDLLLSDNRIEQCVSNEGHQKAVIFLHYNKFDQTITIMTTLLELFEVMLSTKIANANSNLYLIEIRQQKK